MKYYFFTKGDKTVPSSRYRAYYLAETLVSRGYEAVVIPVTDYSLGAFFRYLKILVGITRNDVVYLQRPVYNKYFFLAFLVAWLMGRQFIFDIDDAIYEHTPFRTKFFTRFADFVTCGSEKVCEWARTYNKRSYVLTNGLPLSIYTPAEVSNDPSGTPVIGWIGSHPHLFIEVIVPALHALVKKGYTFEIRVIGAMGDRTTEQMLEGIPNTKIIDSLNWADPTEAVREIKMFTIGIMPLRNNSWDQMKHFKALEYMACGVPVVASDNVAVRSILETSDAGFVAASTEDWVSHLSRLLDDAVLRKTLGTRGRKTVEENYSTEATVDRLLNILMKK